MSPNFYPAINASSLSHFLKLILNFKALTIQACLPFFFSVAVASYAIGQLGIIKSAIKVHQELLQESTTVQYSSISHSHHFYWFQWYLRWYLFTSFDPIEPLSFCGTIASERQRYVPSSSHRRQPLTFSMEKAGRRSRCSGMEQSIRALRGAIILNSHIITEFVKFSINDRNFRWLLFNYSISLQ